MRESPSKMRQRWTGQCAIENDRKERASRKRERERVGESEKLCRTKIPAAEMDNAKTKISLLAKYHPSACRCGPAGAHPPVSNYSAYWGRMSDANLESQHINRLMLRCIICTDVRAVINMSDLRVCRKHSELTLQIRNHHIYPYLDVPYC